MFVLHDPSQQGTLDTWVGRPLPGPPHPLGHDLHPNLLFTGILKGQGQETGTGGVVDVTIFIYVLLMIKIRFPTVNDGTVGKMDVIL